MPAKGILPQGLLRSFGALEKGIPLGKVIGLHCEIKYNYFQK